MGRRITRGITRVPDPEPEDEDDDIEQFDGQVITEDEVLEQRLSRLEALLNGSTMPERREVSAPRTRGNKRDDFSMISSGSSDRAVGAYDDSQDIINIRQEVQKITGEDPGEQVGRALLAMLGATLGSHIGGTAGAGIGAALASLLYSNTKVNPLEALLGRRR